MDPSAPTRSNPSATLLLKRAFTDEAATANCDECGRPLDVVVPLDNRWVMCAACAIDNGWDVNDGGPRMAWVGNRRCGGCSQVPKGNGECGCE